MRLCLRCAGAGADRSRGGRAACTGLSDQRSSARLADWPAGAREYPLLKLQQAGLAALYGDDYDRRPDWIDPDLQAQIAAGRTHSGADIARLLLREHVYAALARFFDDYDLLLCPTAPVVSWPVDQLGPAQIGGAPASPRGHAVYTPLFNYCQVPACSVPVGLVDGLPVGMQIVAPRYQDGQVLSMAGAVEATVGRSAWPAEA